MIAWTIVLIVFFELFLLSCTAGPHRPPIDAPELEWNLNFETAVEILEEKCPPNRDYSVTLVHESALEGTGMHAWTQDCGFCPILHVVIGECDHHSPRINDSLAVYSLAHEWAHLLTWDEELAHGPEWRDKHHECLAALNLAD